MGNCYTTTNKSCFKYTQSHVSKILDDDFMPEDHETTKN